MIGPFAFIVASNPLVSTFFVSLALCSPVPGDCFASVDALFSLLANTSVARTCKGGVLYGMGWKVIRYPPFIMIRFWFSPLDVLVDCLFYHWT